jgi:hypothetical protein
MRKQQSINSTRIMWQRHLALGIVLAVASAVSSVAHWESQSGVVAQRSSRTLLQSGTTCARQIPGCMDRRCTTRTVEDTRSVYVCLRCKQGFLPALNANKQHIVQCGRYLHMAAPTADPKQTSAAVSTAIRDMVQLCLLLATKADVCHGDAVVVMYMLTKSCCCHTCSKRSNCSLPDTAAVSVPHLLPWEYTVS